MKIIPLYLVLLCIITGQNLTDLITDEESENIFTHSNKLNNTRDFVKNYLINILRNDIRNTYDLDSEIKFTSESLKKISFLTKNISVIKIDYEKNFFKISLMSDDSYINIYGTFKLIQRIPVIIKRFENKISNEHIGYINYAIDPQTNTNDIILYPEELIGKSLSNYQLNQPIFKKNIQIYSDIKKNSIVKIKAKCKNMVIEVPGKILHDASYGDIVDIENISSKKIIKCIANIDGSVSPIEM